jgi:hypothetical protein
MNKKENIIKSILKAAMSIFILTAFSMSAQALTNAGFETGATAPWVFYSDNPVGSSFTTTSPGFVGTYAGLVYLNSGGSNIQVYQAGETLEPNTQYTLSFAAKSSSGHDMNVLLIKHGAPFTNYGLTYTASLTTSWQTFSTTFTTSGFSSIVSDARLMFYLAPYATAGDTYYIDDVKLEKVSGPPPPPPPTGLIQNPGFELGTSPWFFFSSGAGSFHVGPPAYEGSNAAVLTLNCGADNLQLHQDSLPLKPYTQYKLTFAAYSTTGHDVDAVLLKNGAPYTNYGLLQQFNLGTSWSTFSTTFTTSGFSSNVNDGRLMFYLVPYVDCSDSYYYFDNVQLEEVGAVTLPPAVIANSPTGTDVPVTAPITVTFSKPMNQASAEAAFSISPLVTGTKSWVGNMMIFTPDAPLAYSTPYTVTIGTGAQDTGGIPMAAPYVWTFTTRALVSSTNLISNPGFESGPADWWFFTNGVGSFTVDGPGYTPLNGLRIAHVEVIVVGSNTQLYQKDIMLEPYTDYQLKFDAYSSSGNDVEVVLLKHISPYTNYGLDQTFNLGTSWSTFSTTFTTSGFSGMVNDGRLMFWFAPYASPGDHYFIDNVELKKI